MLNVLIELLSLLVTLLLLGSIGARYVLGDTGRPEWPIVATWLAGAALLVLQISRSHAAAEPGPWPIAGTTIHWLAAALWAGTAFHISVIRRPAHAEPARAVALITRYARLSLAGAAIAGATGGLLAFVHIHNPDALATSAYGAAYLVKLGVAALLLLSVAVQQLRAAGARRNTPADAELQKIATRFVRHVRIEALLLFGLLLATALLAVRTPPGLAPFLNPQTWSVTAGDLPLEIELQPVAGRISQVRFEITAANPDRQIEEGTRVLLSMLRQDGDGGERDIEALPVGPGEFLAESIIAMPGDWRLDLRLEFPNGEVLTASHVVTLPGPPLRDDMRAYLNLVTIGYSAANAVSFAVGLLLVAAGVWSYRLSTRGVAPGWFLALGFASAAVGGLLVLSVMFVKTYPSSFWANPEPYTAANIRAGDSLYREHCADCHGLNGAGDGPWAIEQGGSLPDLTSPHMDSHTDGEIYWWIRYGIPSLDMPGYAGELSDAENWTVINFMRSLRHGMPPEQ